jgi:hypothetical protein
MDFCAYDFVICVLLLVLIYLVVSTATYDDKQQYAPRQGFLNSPAQGGADSLIGIVPHIDRRIIS